MRHAHLAAVRISQGTATAHGVGRSLALLVWWWRSWTAHARGIWWAHLDEKGTSIFRVCNTAHTTLPKCSRRNNVPLPRHLRFGLWQRSVCPVTAFDQVPSHSDGRTRSTISIHYKRLVIYAVWHDLVCAQVLSSRSAAETTQYHTSFSN